MALEPIRPAKRFLLDPAAAEPPPTAAISEDDGLIAVESLSSIRSVLVALKCDRYA